MKSRTANVKRSIAVLIVAAAFLSAAGLALAAPAIVKGQKAPAAHYTDGKCSRCHAAPSRTTAIPAGHYNTVCTACHTVYPAGTVIPPVPPSVGTVPTSIQITAPTLPTRFGGLVTASAVVTDPAAAIAGSPYVVFERRATSTTKWTVDGVGVWNAALGRYTASRKYSVNTYVRFTFSGDPAHAKSASAQVLVRSYAALAKPVAPASVKKGAKFSVTALLTSARMGTTSFSFARLVGGKWVTASTKRARLVSLRPVRYSVTTLLKIKGRWQIKGLHSDAAHAPTVSGPRYITVR
jgi:hypothetical protein